MKHLASSEERFIQNLANVCPYENFHFLNFFLITQELVDLKHPHVVVLQVRKLGPFGNFSHFFHNQQRIAK